MDENDYEGKTTKDINFKAKKIGQKDNKYKRQQTGKPEVKVKNDQRIAKRRLSD